MRLLIRRSQKPNTGFFGGHKGMIFILQAMVQLTPQEQQLMATYRVENEVLTWRDGSSGDQVPGLRIGDLLRGINYEFQDISMLLHNEEVIKGACAQYKTYLEVMASFGGEEVLEF